MAADEEHIEGLAVEDAACHRQLVHQYCDSDRRREDGDSSEDGFKLCLDVSASDEEDADREH